jgi:Domain of unknown function (DUF1906)
VITSGADADARSDSRRNRGPAATRDVAFIGMKLFVAIVLISCMASPQADVKPTQARAAAFLGFDTNIYPGDPALDSLRKTFFFSGYWLNAPPGGKSSAGKSSTWTGKRRLLRSKGFGFLILFNGKTYSELKASGDPAGLGARDGEEAIRVARKEGFPARAIIFLDLEEGGRLLAEQRGYLHAWTDAVNQSGYRAGVYCSGIASHEGAGAAIVTADDIRENAAGRDITYFVANDQCPPSPGCALPKTTPAASGIAFAQVWQFAQSPRRKQFTSACAGTYASDGNCYGPGKTLVDLDVATSDDPSHGR